MFATTGTGSSPWTPAENDTARALATVLVQLEHHYTSISAQWLQDVGQWIVVYSKAANDPANNQVNPAGSVVARFGANPWSWSAEVEVFNTCRDLAYGHFMHWTGIDDINTRVPPPVWGDAPGWAYGAFLLDGFAKLNPASRELSIAYLMSTSNPYQVQVMRTRLQMPLILAHPTVETLMQLRDIGIDFSVPQSELIQWLGDARSTPYPAISTALLNLLEGRRLRQPVYLDVVVWNYEHAPGASSPRKVADVDVGRLKAAVLEGYNGRYGEAVSDFQTLIR